MSLGLTRREDSHVRTTAPIPTLNDSICETDESRFVHPATFKDISVDSPDSVEKPENDTVESSTLSFVAHKKLPDAVQKLSEARISSESGTLKDLHPINRDLLRIGTSTSHLSQLADDTYTRFLSDIIGEFVFIYTGAIWCTYSLTENSRARAQASSSVEELAMHRVLSEYVYKMFSKPDSVLSLRNDMVTAAIDVSLSYHNNK